MKFAIFASTFLYSSLLLAGNLYSIEKVTYDVTRSQNENDIVFCKIVDADHNLVSGCTNLNLLTKYSLQTSSEGKVLLTSKTTSETLQVGSTNKTKKFQLDDMDKAVLVAVESEENVQFDVNLLSKSGLVLNREIGCKAPFECDWSIFTSETKLSLEIKLEGKRLEKIKLY